jgi:hypothetical protein
MLASMDDLGQPSSYMALKRGASVYSSDGERLGKVVRVLRDLDADVFDGVVFDTTAGPGGHRFVDGPEVGEIYEGGVVLKLDAAASASLPAPAANPGSLKVNPDDLAGGGGGFLRRAWNSLSGRR